MVSKKIWKKYFEQLRNEIKWLPPNMGFTVDLTVPPAETTVKGKFGEQTVYIVQTSIGKCYLSKKQFLQLCEAIEKLNAWEQGVMYCKTDARKNVIAT